MPFLKLHRQNLIRVALVAIAYSLVGWLTLYALKLGTGTSPLWLPAGIALAALLWWGEKMWLGIAVGDLLMMVISGASFTLALSSALGSSLSALVGVKLLQCLKFSLTLTRLRDVIAFVAIGALFSPTINATVDLVAQGWLGQLAFQDFWQQWWTLWLGDGAGILVVTPFLLQLSLLCRKPPPRSPQKILEMSIILGLLAGVSWVVFTEDATVNFGRMGLTNARYLEYLPFPFVVWLSLRFQLWGAIWASLFISSIGIVGIGRGVGSFIVQTSTLSGAILLLQTYISIITTTALLLAAAVAERQQIEKQLRLTLESDRLFSEIALKIRQSLNLEDIFNTAVAEIRTLVRVDRVYIGYIKDGGQIKIVAESVAPGYSSLLDCPHSQQLLKDLQKILSSRELLLVDDTDVVELPLTFKKYYATHHIKASLVVPLRLDNRPLGLIGVHQCTRVRHWRKQEIQLLERLATQVTIALQQAQLYQQVQKLNHNLEGQVEERTLQLQEKIEEAQQLYEIKTVLLQAVTHDFRTSMMGLSMLLRNLQNQSGDKISLSRAILERTIASCDRQLTLINAISEDLFAEARSLVIHPQKLQFSEFVKPLLKDWQPLFTRYQGTINNLIPDNLPAISADPQQLRCVFEQLLTNALKHNPPGIQVTINAEIREWEEIGRRGADADGDGVQCAEIIPHSRLAYKVRREPTNTAPHKRSAEHRAGMGRRREPGNGDNIALVPSLCLLLPSATCPLPSKMFYCTITDNGTGMEAQQCDRLFKLFVRSLDNQRLTGIGLGSYQCRQIIEAHGGKIGVNSRLGVGSQFWFVLPI